jgi:sulfite exporter TauE/SafE
MSLVPGIPNPYLGAFAGGLFYGSVFCTASCLPYVASYIAGTRAGFREGILTTFIYNFGRVTAYALIGAAIGLFGGAIRAFTSEAIFVPFQKYSSVAFGTVTIVIGLCILLKSKSQTCFHNETGKTGPKKSLRWFEMGAFTLGFSRGLIICAPLLALLLTSVAFATPIDSLILAVLFGLGTTISPILIIGGATGWLLNKAPLFRRWIALFGGGILIALGVGTLLSAAVAG